MSLAHIILGLLQQKEKTGYDLKTADFDQAIAHLWSADQAQIYRTLDKLVEQGCIVCTVEIQKDRPNRKVYRLTEAGQAELVRWLQCSQPLPTVREPLLVQLVFAAQLSNEAIAHLLEQQLTAHHKRLANCQAIAVPLFNEPSATREQVMHRLVLDLMVQKEQTYIDWLKRAIAVINQQEP